MHEYLLPLRPFGFQKCGRCVFFSWGNVAVSTFHKTSFEAIYDCFLEFFSSYFCEMRLIWLFQEFCQNIRGRFRYNSMVQVNKTELGVYKAYD